MENEKWVKGDREGMAGESKYIFFYYFLMKEAGIAGNLQI